MNSQENRKDNFMMQYILANCRMQTLFSKAVIIYEVTGLKGGALLQLSEWQQTGTLHLYKGTLGHWDSGIIGFPIAGRCPKDTTGGLRARMYTKRQLSGSHQF